MEIRKKCPMCGKVQGLIVSKEDAKAIELYYQKRDLIQNLLPNMSIQKREFIISGYCPQRCQSLLFGSKYIEDNEWVE